MKPSLDCGGNSRSRHNHRIVVVDKAENNYPESQSGGLFCRQSCIFGSCSEKFSAAQEFIFQFFNHETAADDFYLTGALKVEPALQKKVSFLLP